MMTAKESVSLRPAQEKDRELIKNIFNMYQNELSVYSDDFLYLDENGYFAPDTADEILPFGDGVYPYIITHEGKNIGFVMMTDARYAENGADYCLQEIFLVRPFRGTGAARTVVRRLFNAHPGNWILDVYGRNLRARAFWKHILSEFDEHSAEQPLPGGLVRMIFRVPGGADRKRGEYA